MKQLVFALCLLTITISSCRKAKVTLSSSGYLIFGHFYGECTGENCIEIFRLEKDQLLEDTKDIYPGASCFNDGNYRLLPQKKFNDGTSGIQRSPCF